MAPITSFAIPGLRPFLPSTSFHRVSASPARPSFVPSVPSCRRPRVVPTMIGPFFPDLSSSNLMKSEIVRKEMGSLERDYVELSKLGTRYETFDTQGKQIFIERALDVVDRFAIFLTRLKLSEEFAAQMFIKQYTLKLQEVGLTIDSLVENTKKSLEMMREDIDKKGPLA